MIIGKYPSLRLRRNRKESWSRRLIQENTLSPNDFVLPIFLIDGSNKKTKNFNYAWRFQVYGINRLSQSCRQSNKNRNTYVALSLN